MRGQLTFESHTVIPGAEARPEYLRLPRDLSELARGFDLSLPLDCQRDAAILVFAIECVDRILDSLPTPGQRVRLAAEVLAVLEGSVESNDLAMELSHWLSRLREVTQRRNISETFCRITRRILSNSERMRRTRHPAFYVHAALVEGRLMVELLLLILGSAATRRFSEFMRRVGGPANLGDKLRDARRDFLLGELAIRPGILLYVRLGSGMLWRIIALAVRFCRHGRVLVWGLKSLYTEMALTKARTA